MTTGTNRRHQARKCQAAVPNRVSALRDWLVPRHRNRSDRRHPCATWCAHPALRSGARVDGPRHAESRSPFVPRRDPRCRCAVRPRLGRQCPASSRQERPRPRLSRRDAYCDERRYYRPSAPRSRAFTVTSCIRSPGSSCRCSSSSWACASTLPPSVGWTSWSRGTPDRRRDAGSLGSHHRSAGHRLCRLPAQPEGRACTRLAGAEPLIDPSALQPY
jgi:hypothetical protein